MNLHLMQGSITMEVMAGAELRRRARLGAGGFSRWSPALSMLAPIRRYEEISKGE
jgi:hypothetical protein